MMRQETWVSRFQADMGTDVFLGGQAVTGYFLEKEAGIEKSLKLRAEVGSGIGILG